MNKRIIRIGCIIFSSAIIIILLVFAFIIIKDVSIKVKKSNKNLAVKKLERDEDFISKSVKAKNFLEVEKICDYCEIVEIEKLTLFDNNLRDNGYCIKGSKNADFCIINNKSKPIVIINKDIQNKNKTTARIVHTAANGIVDLTSLLNKKELKIGVRLKNVKNWKYCIITNLPESSGWTRGYWFFDSNKNVVDFLVTIDESACFW